MVLSVTSGEWTCGKAVKIVKTRISLPRKSQFTTARLFPSLIKVSMFEFLSLCILWVLTVSWNMVQNWINHLGKSKKKKEKSGSSTCCSSIYLVWIARPWHRLKLFMRPYAPCLLSPARTHCEEPGRYQSLAHGFFIFCVTWDCVDVTSDWCIRSDCSCAPTAHKALFFWKKPFFPEAEFFLRLFHLKSEGYVACRGAGPINSCRDDMGHQW